MAQEDTPDDIPTPWHISADKISYDNSQDRYIAEGNVAITKEDNHLSADIVRFSRETTTVSASGRVSLTSGEDVLTGSRMELDFASEIGRIEDAHLFSKPNHFHMSGKTIEKSGEDTYGGEQVTVSTCDGDCPAWRVTGKRLKVTVDGYGHITHGTLWIKNIPVFYTPFFSFPAKVSRQSGFLAPQIGISDRQGLTYDQALFWAIDDHSDATFFVRHMSYRGIKAGLEYRYAGKAQSKGTLMVDGLSDRKVDNGSPNLSGNQDSWGYSGDTVLRPNSDRYWVRMKHNQNLPRGYQAEVDLDIVSDQDYLHEFRSGYAGYDSTEVYFSENFDRVLDRYDDPIRMNRLNIRKAWNGYSINGEARWYDDVIRRRQGGTDTPLHRLPFLGFNALKQKVLDTPFYFDLDTGYTYFYRETGTHGHRMTAHTRLYLPYRFEDRIALEPSIGLHQTIWETETADDDTAGMDTSLYRGTYDLRLDLSTALYRIFAGRDNKRISAKGLKHIIRPRVVYEYAPDFCQDEFPFSDSDDRIQTSHRLTYGLTNILISRSSMPEKIEEMGETQREGLDRMNYRQILRFSLEQSYDLEKSNDSETEPLSPVYAGIEWMPMEYISLDADAQWSIDENRFTEHNTVLSLYDNRGDRLFIEHRFTRKTTESIIADVNLQLSDNWSAYGNYERNIYEGKKIKQGIGLLYRAQCWSLEIRYSEEENDNRFEFFVNLFGLSDFEFLKPPLR